ncbi:LamG-like jellyroll fold domain-containing protein, partial [Bacteroidota bacterium]
DTAVRIGIGSYYKSYHDIAPNGGGDSVNRYSLMFDFKVLSLNNWHAFHQTDTTNTNDGDCFIRPNSSSTPGAIGVGYTGYSTSAISPNKWYRLVISINLGHYYRYYLNGNLIHEGDTDEIFIDQRFALTPAILFFADDYQEDDTIDIASLAIFDTCLTASQIATIGTIDPCVLNPVVAHLGNDTAFCEGGGCIYSGSIRL